jgi:hypothetical protein
LSEVKNGKCVNTWIRSSQGLRELGRSGLFSVTQRATSCNVVLFSQR